MQVSGLSDLSDLSAAGRTAKLPPSLLVLSDLSDLSDLIIFKKALGIATIVRMHIAIAFVTRVTRVTPVTGGFEAAATIRAWGEAGVGSNVFLLRTVRRSLT